MALKSLLFRSGAKVPDETRFGYVIYDGSARDYPYWRFRTELKLSCVPKEKPEEYAKCARDIIEALRGDPLQTAIDMGISTLTSQEFDGITTFMDKVLNDVFPLKDEEAKALYQEGHKIGGLLSRQPSENMTCYIMLYTTSRTMV